MSGSALAVHPVRGARDFAAFLALPSRLYRGDRHWVPPLLAERRRFLDPRRNPFFDHGEAALWLARRGRRVVGRISSHVDRLHDATHGERLGMFGFFECEDDLHAARALVDAAKGWVCQRGATRLRGPLSFSLHHECGMLVDGWDGPPTFMMPYNPPRYPALLESAGLAKAADLLTYTIRRADLGDGADRLPPALVRAAALAGARSGVTVRRAERREFAAEVARGLAIFRDAWRDNWGFVPPTDREAVDLAAGLERIADPALSFFAERDGVPVGLAMSIADANRVLARLGGRLLPFGWLRALWYARRVDAARLLLFGVCREHRRRGVEAALMAATLEAFAASRYATLELGWVLEDNVAVRRLLEPVGVSYGLAVHRRYRIYEVPLGACEETLHKH